jgi:hypothetical protein
LALSLTVVAVFLFCFSSPFSLFGIAVECGGRFSLFFFLSCRLLAPSRLSLSAQCSSDYLAEPAAHLSSSLVVVVVPGAFCFVVVVNSGQLP